MGKTIEELFKTKVLNDGKTAEQKYDIRNSKDIPLRSSTGAMDLPFKAAQLARKNLSSRTTETRLEGEVTGLRLISKLGAPIIYGTDILKLSTQKTEMVTEMKNSVNPNNSTDNGLLGNLFEKGKTKGLELLNKIGVQLPTKLIPTRISLNSDFKAGKEPDTMVTLAKIKGDGAGNLVGKFLAQNVKGSPKQIGNQILGGGINLLKAEIKKKLFGAPKQGAQNLAKKSEDEVQYDSTARYSDTINPNDEDYFKRNDLSSVLVAKETKDLGGGPAVSKKIDELVPRAKDIFNTSQNPFAKIGDKLKDVKQAAEQKLSEAKKQGQQEISNGKKIGDSKDNTSAASYDSIIKYSDTVDETQDDIKLRNDLSSKLEALNAASATLNTSGTSVSREAVGINTYSSLKDGQIPKVSLKTKYGIDSKTKSDIVNEKTQYAGSELKIGSDTLDDYDFITLKFTSIAKKQSVNFRATLSGITETTTPSWDPAKFIGSPFNYYTYSGIERSVSFNFKVYSTTPAQHIAAWQRLNFLTSLAYPQGYNAGIAVLAPFLRITIGNLYKNKECFISQLSYTVDDNGTWEVGPTAGMGIADNQSFKINSETTSIDNYKLPKIIDVSVSLTFVESKSNTVHGYLYGFDKLPRDKGRTLENTAAPAEAASDVNNKQSVAQSEASINTNLSKVDTTSVAANVNNPAQSTSANSSAGMENSAGPKVEPPPTYKIQVSKIADGFDGKVFANGKLIYDNFGLPFQSDYFTYGEDNKKYTGEAGVKEFLRYKSKISGWTGIDGKTYAASNNIT
jgi:hypothetical protein